VKPLLRDLAVLALVLALGGVGAYFIERLDRA
jgi:uncharacterized protein (UPF0333 family)